VRLGAIAVCAIPLAVVGRPSVARADPQGASLRIDCPTLEGETRARFEARAEAELAAEQVAEGKMSVSCDATTATVRWSPKTGPFRERDVPIRGDAAMDDVLLGTLDELLFVPPPPAPTPPQPAPMTPAPRPAPPQEAAVARRIVQVAALAGADAELWHGDVPVALGAHAGIVVSPSLGWRLSLAIAPQWGVGDADGIRAWELRVYARAEYELFPHIEVGAGLSGRSLWATGPASDPVDRNGITWGLVVSARYAVRLGWVEVSIGPRLEALVRPIAVHFDGAETFRVPSFVAGLGLEALLPAWTRPPAAP
jgi:hypothetical protein